MLKVASPLLSVLLLSALPASAAVIRFDFHGVVTDNAADLGVFGPLGTVVVGDVITGHFSYEIGLGNPDLDPGDPNTGVYSLLTFDVDQAVVSITPVGVAVLLSPVPLQQIPANDRLRVVGSFDLGGETRFLSVDLRAPFGTAFADDSLPGSLALATFTAAHFVQAIRFVGLEMGQVDRASLVQLTQVPDPFQVPEPAVAALLSIAASCGWWQTRRGRSVRRRS